METPRQSNPAAKSCPERPSAKSLGICTEKPKFPQYAVIARRTESFQEQNWPVSCPVQVQDLVEAGLVYTGEGDSVRCYYCGGGLKNWERGDIAIVEHARWYPTCPHVLLVKGHKFVQRVLEGRDSEEPTEAAASRTSSKELDVFQNPTTLALLECGYQEDNIRKAITIFSRRHGNREYDSEQLCEILLEMEDDPGAFDNCNLASGEEDLSTVNTVDDSELQNLVEENHRLKDDQLCKICSERKGDIVFLPCCHKMSCGQCAPALKKCPICRKVIQGLLKSFTADFKEIRSNEELEESDCTFVDTLLSQ